MKKAIVTGANGFVGGATLRELLHHGYEVWAVGHQDHFSNVPEDPNVTLAAASSKPLLYQTKRGAAAACRRIARRIEGSVVPIAL